MPKSRMTMLLILACCPGAAQSQPMDAQAPPDAADVLKPLVLTGCPRGDEEEGEIVVCGQRGAEPYRLPLPVEPTPGARVPGGVPSGVDAMVIANDPCTPVGRQQRCSGGLPIIPMILTGVKIVEKLVDPDD